MISGSIRNIKNVFVQLIALLGIKYTKSYSYKYSNEHPYKNTLFGLSKMLFEYGINNIGLRLNNKDELHSLEVPFVAQLQEDFVIVYKVTADKVSYLWRGKDITVLSEEFNNIWSGVVLLVEADQESIEPDYVEHRKNEFFVVIEKYILGFAVFVMMVISYISNKTYENIGENVSLFINIVGVYIGYLLILKQLHIQSDNADKLCSLFKKGECNNVLESSAAKFMGIIGWSEVGFGYFLSNVLILIFVPQFIPYLVWINICALPYSFWSVWYQKVKVKQWCPLCLIVQGILWAIFICSYWGGLIRTPEFTILNILSIGCIYLVPFLMISLLMPVLSVRRKAERINQEINSLRMKNEVFLSVLKQQPYFKVDRSVSKIIFGNPDASLTITILTNPYCNPCERMHARIEKILEKSGKKLCIQYVFSSFEKALENTARKLIAIYMDSDKKTIMNIYKEWFTKGKYNPEFFFEKYKQNIDDPVVEAEFQKHLNWKEQTGINATPRILINGYKLPSEQYKIEDVVYFTDLVVDSK